jgi:hypothetical protein
MKLSYRLGTLFVFVSALAWAETWTGRLVNANCADPQKIEACTPSNSTTSFALYAGEKMYKFDAEGNKKAAAAFEKSRSGAERAKDPDSPDQGVTATVNGTMARDQIKVDSIEVQ